LFSSVRQDFHGVQWFEILWGSPNTVGGVGPVIYVTDSETPVDCSSLHRISPSVVALKEHLTFDFNDLNEML